MQMGIWLPSPPSIHSQRLSSYVAGGGIKARLSTYAFKNIPRKEERTRERGKRGERESKYSKGDGKGRGRRRKERGSRFLFLLCFCSFAPFFPFFVKKFFFFGAFYVVFLTFTLSSSRASCFVAR